MRRRARIGVPGPKTPISSQSLGLRWSWDRKMSVNEKHLLVCYHTSDRSTKTHSNLCMKRSEMRKNWYWIYIDVLHKRCLLYSVRTLASADIIDPRSGRGMEMKGQFIITLILYISLVMILSPNQLVHCWYRNLDHWKGESRLTKKLWISLRRPCPRSRNKKRVADDSIS